jgi:hypothetical protein
VLQHSAAGLHKSKSVHLAPVKLPFNRNPAGKGDKVRNFFLGCSLPARQNLRMHRLVIGRTDRASGGLTRLAAKESMQPSCRERSMGMAASR